MAALPRLALVLALACLAGNALAVAPDYRIHDDQFGRAPLTIVTRGLRIPEAQLSSLTAAGSSTATALEAASSWDFRPSATLPGATDSVAQNVPATSAWTCYLPDTLGCGFGTSEFLSVSDTVNAGTPRRGVFAYDYDDAAGKLIGRATIVDEGLSSEVRICFEQDPDTPEIPILLFPNTDGQGRFLRAGDPPWQSGIFNCVGGVTQDGACRTAGTAAFLNDGPSTEGRLKSRIVKSGTVTLPSGHVVDAVLLETLYSYDIHVNCFFPSVSTLRQYRLSWLVPHYGSLISLTSQSDVASLNAFTSVSSTFLGFGLLPPVSLTATDVGFNQTRVAWNPGSITRGITGFEVHWGTQSGSVVAPPFSSGPLPASARDFTITGLTQGQTYYVSVTTLGSYTDPVSNVTTAYESIALPQSIGADIDGDGDRDTSYPPEISVTTVAGACVKGDMTGDQLVKLEDFAIMRRHVRGDTTPTAQQITCGDVHPGQTTCTPQGLPEHWCITGGDGLKLGDIPVLRKRVAGLSSFSCAACQGALLGAGDSLRKPGDVAPRGDTDALVTVSDVVVALRASVGLETLTVEETLRADVAPVNRASGLTVPVGDGALNVSDVVILLRASVGLETLAWPERRIAARFGDEVPYVAFTVATTGWPAWATVSGFEAPDCNSGGLDTAGGLFSILCDLETERTGPEDLAAFVYRAPEPVSPALLSIVNMEVADPSYASIDPATITLESR